MEKTHGNTGKKRPDLKKDNPLDAVLTFRLSKEQKAEYIKAANGKPLKEWCLSILDAAITKS